MNSELREFLEGVSKDGEMRSRDDMVAVLPSTASRSGRESDVRTLRTTVRKIVALRGEHSESEDADSEIEGLIAAAEERFSAGLPDKLANQIRSSRDDNTAGIETRRQKAEAYRQKVSDLVDTFKHAGLEGGVDLHEVRKLRLRPDLTAQQREQFERDVIKAGKRVADIHRSGALQSARLVAQNAANELSDYLASRQHVDPLRDEDDPRALAAAIVARQRGE